MSDEPARTTRGEEAQARRTLARYRRLVLLGKAALPLAQARLLLGPDCAYHLYFRHAAAGRTALARRRRGRTAAAATRRP